ncbi:MAG TPA: proline--tRNA ligase [Thermoanaerobaculia bacterium]|nr:proline--tRNA ligase [Thermoanaerobaculia bacterium]
MRWSRYYLYTTREVPNDAEVISHQLMVRAGMIKKAAAGIYTYLPFGWRSLSKLMAIVRREIDATGAAELMGPCIQPAELWQESGRWQRYGKELLRIKDRHERDFVFGPTHEEIVTDILRRDLKSYRQLPVSLYQIQTKFRDEIRPRFGLMCGREFLMKDAYSFHTSAESLDETYQDMHRAYCRIFEACKLDYTVVEADTGSIGGSASHEFMVVADTGESAVVRCPVCGYAANTEKAETRRVVEEGKAFDPQELQEVATPGKHSVEDVARFLKVNPKRIVKTLIYETEKGLVAALIRGDREINEVKLANHLDVQHLNLASEDKVRQATGAPVGFAGPVGLKDVRLVADESVRGMSNFVVGANKADAHLTGVNPGRDVDLAEWADFLLVGGGDPCPRCDGKLEVFRGIEVGHIFKLGTKYSEAMGCNYTDEAGADHPMIMGCYGVGIGRTVAAAIEQNHDADGIIWPRPLAPFEVLLVGLNPDDAEVSRTAEQIYAELREKGVDVLYDDRDERPGVKFKDADLIGIPVRLVVGAKSLKDGQVEVSLRRDRQKNLVSVAESAGKVLELLEA